jgi:hypothetical protein
VLGAAKTLVDADGELAHLTMEGEHLNAEFNVCNSYLFMPLIPTVAFGYTVETIYFLVCMEAHNQAHNLIITPSFGPTASPSSSPNWTA